LGLAEESATPNKQRDVRAMAATMDHSDIRVLGNALHLFFAGLPRSRSWDHRVDAHIKRVEDSPHRSRASRCLLGVLPGCGAVVAGSPLVFDGSDRLSVLDLDLAGRIPDEACEFPSDRNADLVLIEFASHRKASPAFGQAQLSFPGDIADDLRLTLLAYFERSGDLRLEAIVPGRFHQDAPGVFVATFW
jgi:hypothetical protein